MSTGYIVWPGLLVLAITALYSMKTGGEKLGIFTLAAGGN